jgi:hypothetical protein
MAEHTHSGPVEVGAPMDYQEHQRTFAGVIALVKVSILASIATLQSLTLMGIARNAFWPGALLLLLMFVATAVAVVTKGSIKALVAVVIFGFLLMALSLG